MGATGALIISQMTGQAASGYSQGEGSKAQGQYQRTMSDINARNADLAAADAEKRGENESQDYLKKVGRMVGSQRASAAAQGLDVNSGDIQTIQNETREIGAMDALTIRNNAFREGLGYKQKANAERGQGRLAEIGGNFQQKSSLLGGGMKALETGITKYIGTK